MGMINYSKGGEGGGWTPLPEGTFHIRITKAEQGTSSKGNPQVQVGGEVLDGDYSGKKVTIWYSLTPQSTWKVDKLLDALGIERVETGEHGPDGMPILGFDTDHLVGRAVKYTVTQREYPPGTKKMTNSFDDESESEYDEVEDDEPQAAPAPAQAKAAPAPVQTTLPGTENPAMRRRPRPVGPPQ